MTDLDKTNHNLLLGLNEVHELLGLIIENPKHDLVLNVPKQVRNSNVVSVKNRLRFLMKEIEFLRQDISNGTADVP